MDKKTEHGKDTGNTQGLLRLKKGRVEALRFRA